MIPDIVTDEKAREVYLDVERLCKQINVENPNIKEEDLVKKVIGCNLITQPINEDEPFNVENNTNRLELNGQDFSIDSLKLSAVDTINGGRFDIQFVASPPYQSCKYNLDITINQSPYAIRVKEASIGSY